MNMKTIMTLYHHAIFGRKYGRRHESTTCNYFLKSVSMLKPVGVIEMGCVLQCKMTLHHFLCFPALGLKHWNLIWSIYYELSELGKDFPYGLNPPLWGTDKDLQKEVWHLFSIKLESTHYTYISTVLFFKAKYSMNVISQLLCYQSIGPIRPKYVLNHPYFPPKPVCLQVMLSYIVMNDFSDCIYAIIWHENKLSRAC